MISLDFGNVLLKPAQRRQIMSWLKRTAKLGSRLGQFVLRITMHRIGKAFEVRASVQDRVGHFDCRARQADWRHAMRDMVNLLSKQLSHQRLAIS